MMRVRAGVAVRRALLACVAIPVTACAALPISPAEQVYQVANAIDWVQTINVARQPQCYREVGWPTESIIGRHPNVTGVLVFGAVQAVLHAAVSAWLENNHWTHTLAVWQTLTIGNEVVDVARNAGLGMRPFGAHGDADCDLGMRMPHDKTL
jgi:hypothetical protein